MRAGRLSAEQANAVTDAAAVNPAAEADLLDLAQRESLQRTRAEADQRKAEATSEEAKRQRDERIRRERRARCSYRNGAGHLEAIGPVAAIKELEQALNSLVDQRMRATKAIEDREPAAAYRFDALIEATPEHRPRAPATSRGAAGCQHAGSRSSGSISQRSPAATPSPASCARSVASASRSQNSAARWATRCCNSSSPTAKP